MTLAVVVISGSEAKSETIQITSGFAQQFSTPDFNGSFVMTFDVNGLPVGAPVDPQSDGPSVILSNLSIIVKFDNGSTDVARDGAGTITSRYAGFGMTVLDYLSFSAGDIGGLFALVNQYNGTGGVLLDDGENSSLIQAGQTTGYLNSPSSFVVAPEPVSFVPAGGSALALIALFQTRARRNRFSKSDDDWQTALETCRNDHSV